MKRFTMLAAFLAFTGACSTDSAKNADTSAAMGDTTAALSPAAAATDSAAMPAPSASASASGMIDPNSASAADLATVPGITPDLAAAVTAGRPYSDNTGVDKLLAKSLTEKQRDSVYTRLWIPLDLNKASDAEIQLIPGVGARMLREFREYRPYTSMEQFSREIGKYVDKAELARLESYVRI